MILAIIILASLSILSLYISLKAYRSTKNLLYMLQRYPRVIDRLSKIIESKKRPRKRYIVFRLISSNPISGRELDKIIRDTVKNVIGVKGLAETDYALIDYDETTGLGIIRSNNRTYKLLIGLLGLVRSINDVKILIVPVSAHGTIKKAREKIKSLTK